MKKSNGITLVSLVITIILLIIIAGITIYEGKETIKKAKLEQLKTNMLLIQAKAKEYVEEAQFKIGTDESKTDSVKQEIYEEKAKLEKATNISAPGSIPVANCYVLTSNTFETWGLNKIEISDGEYYLIEFNENEASAEVYNTLGYDGKYSLTDIDAIE